MTVIKPKIIVILGQTSSGKSDLAVKIAEKFSGEVISADSRQVYRGMDLGTGKITKKEMRGIPHYLLSIADPKKIFTAADYKKLAKAAIDKIFNKGKLPIICGGTGFYIQALIDGIIIPEVAPDWKLRKKLEGKSTDYLYNLLKKLDKKRAERIDKKNSRRLIRAIEIIKKTGKTIPVLKKKPLPYPVLFLGIKKTPEELKRLIRKRLMGRLKAGMVKEIENLHKPPTGGGVSWKRLEEFGLEYRRIAQFLQKKIDHADTIQKIQKETENFAKRQMTWFKKDKRIKWIRGLREAEKLVKDFLEK